MHEYLIPRVGWEKETLRTDDMERGNHVYLHHWTMESVGLEVGEVEDGGDTDCTYSYMEGGYL